MPGFQSVRRVFTGLCQILYGPLSVTARKDSYSVMTGLVPTFGHTGYLVWLTIWPSKGMSSSFMVAL